MLSGGGSNISSCYIHKSWYSRCYLHIILTHVL